MLGNLKLFSRLTIDVWTFWMMMHFVNGLDKKVRTQYLWQNGYPPKPGFRDCQTKMKMFPFYYLLGQENTGFYNWPAIKPIFSSDITGTQKLDSWYLFCHYLTQYLHSANFYESVQYIQIYTIQIALLFSY